jgi:uncharacterized protein (TIGR02246 family)
MTEIESAWNAHDMRRFAACFAADADFVNVGGWWWRGRDEIERMHTVLHRTIFRDSRMQMSLAAVREVGPELVVVHVKWRMTGHTVGGVRQTADDREGIWSWVIRHDDGRATIVSSHNTDTMEVPPTHPLAGL